MYTKLTRDFPGFALLDEHKNLVWMFELNKSRLFFISMMDGIIPSWNNKIAIKYIIIYIAVSYECYN